MADLEINFQTPYDAGDTPSDFENSNSIDCLPLKISCIHIHTAVQKKSLSVANISVVFALWKNLCIEEKSSSNSNL